MNSESDDVAGFKSFLRLDFILIALSILVSGYPMKAQNLVPNPGFESNTVLPDSNTQWYRCTDWSSVNNQIPSHAPYGSPDYFHTNGSGIVQLPNSGFATINPHTGNAIMGLVMWLQFTPDYREYISAQLNAPLQPGTTYEVSFYVSRGVNPYNPYGSNHIGVHLSNGALTQSTHEPLPVTPQFDLQTVFTDSTWQQMSFQITPTTMLDHITIGNFSPDASTNTQLLGSGAGTGAYIFVDDVVVRELTVLEAGSDTTICAGDSVTLWATGGGQYHWEQAANPGDTIGTDSVLTVAPVQTTRYVAFANGMSDTVVVEVQNAPMVMLGSDTALCEANSLNLTPVIQGAAQWNWSTGDTTASISALNSGVYRITVTNDCGMDVDSIRVTFSELTVSASPDTVICEGDTASLVASGQSIHTVQWSPAGTLESPTATSTLAYPAQSITYTVAATDTLGCIDTDTVTISVSAPVVSLTANSTTIQLGQTVQLLASGGQSWVWEPDVGNGNMATTSPEETTTYSVVGFDVNGCTDEDTLTIRVLEKPGVYIPNAFSPNGDGLNDEFGLIWNTDPQQVEITIYSRWGQVVYQSQGQPWDGKYRGEDMPLGVYAYLIRYTDFAGDTHLESGNVTLLR